MGNRAIKPWLLLVLLLVLSYSRASLSTLADTLSAGQSLFMSNNIISQGRNFELGFFKLGASSKIYLGIWYKGFEKKDVVWVANRENPLFDPSSSRLHLSKDGNLLLLELSSNMSFWLTNLTFPPSNLTEAVLQDDGNFVLRDRLNPSSIFWESFDHPTDTWLPGAKLGIDKATRKPQQLISWKNSDDPAPGVFSFGLDPNGSNQYFLEWNRSQIYWSTGVWNGNFFSLLPGMLTLSSFLNYSFVSDEKERYFTYYVTNPSYRLKYKISSTGQYQLQGRMSGPWVWSLFWIVPQKPSDVYALCGAYGVYQENFSKSCICLEGFEPSSMFDTELDDWSGGCVRKSPLQCENSSYANGKKDWFQKISNIRLPVHSKVFLGVNAGGCELACKKNCSCTAYAYNGSGCMIWEGGLLNLQLLLDGDATGQQIFLRLAADVQTSTKGRKWKVWVILAVLVPPAVVILCLSICSLTRGKLKRIGKEASSNNLLLFDFNTELQATNDGSNTNNNLNTRKKMDVELPLFSYESVLVATNNFSIQNKLGEGGFGPVYKGKLLKGQEIAMKVLSKRSRQGLEEFRNETILIAKLQHRNLVRLLGCCIERDEKILIYEYMSNKSLDLYLFDPSKKMMLGWETRACIIEGIAHGLLYLHKYSRLRIVHRDLKPSNILLDGQMNPKISDFGIARIVGDNGTQANTKRIVGTFGYMSPEYALNGLYSVKSDVFSFGVLLLEIVSGKKNSSFFHSGWLNLIKYAWELWNDDRSLELIDPAIEHPSSSSIILRFIHIGLLCLQENPIDRPTMLDVVSWITNQHAPLPMPKQSAFTAGRNESETNPKIGEGQNCSASSVTISTMEGR